VGYILILANDVFTAANNVYIKKQLNVTVSMNCCKHLGHKFGKLCLHMVCSLIFVGMLRNKYDNHLVIQFYIYIYTDIHFMKLPCSMMVVFVMVI